MGIFTINIRNILLDDIKYYFFIYEISYKTTSSIPLHIRFNKIDRFMMELDI